MGAILKSSINVVKNMCGVEKVAMFVLDRKCQYVRRIASSKELKRDGEQGLYLDATGVVQEICKTKEIFVNREFNRQHPTMMAPVLLKGKVIALVGLYDHDFENITLHLKNSLEVATKLISSSVEKAHRQKKASKSKGKITLLPRGESRHNKNAV